MKFILIDLCQYTLRGSLNDTGEYYEPFMTAQEILDLTEPIKRSYKQ